MQQSYQIIFGVHAIREVLSIKRRSVYKVYSTDPRPKSFATLQTLIPRHVEIVTVSRTRLTDIAESPDHQGIVAAVGVFPFRNSCFNPDKFPHIVLLDGIQDPRNVGAIIRSAYCTGFQGIVIPEKQTAPLSGTVVKSAAGLTERIDIYRPLTSTTAFNELKKAGYNMYVAALGGERADHVVYQAPTCLVIGNEAVGVHAAFIAQGTRITIPQVARDVSYNAAVAAGILLFMISSRSQNIKF